MKRTGFTNPRKPMARGTSTLKTTKPMNRGNAQLVRSKAIQSDPKPAPKKKRGPGLKGRTPTAEERRFMDLAGKVPCMACTIDGRTNHAISLHHIDGRTKPGAHMLVLPLCAPHHQQDDSDPLQRPSVHERKATFTALYGTELELLEVLRKKISIPNV